MNRLKTARILVALGALVLLGSAAIHCIGAYPGLSATLRASNLQPPFPDALRAVFLLAGWDWVIVAAVVLLALRYQSPLSRPLVLLCAVAVLVEAVLTLTFLGWFVGTILVGSGALLLLAGGLTMPPEAAAPSTL